LISKNKHQEDVQVCKVTSLNFSDLSTYVAEFKYTIPVTQLDRDGWSIESPEKIAIFNKLIEAGVGLGIYLSGKIYYGIKTGFNTAFVLSHQEYESIISSSPKYKELIKPFVGGQDIKRFHLTDNQRFLIVIPSGWTKAQIIKSKLISNLSENVAWDWFSTEYPALAEHLEKYLHGAKKRQDKGDFWWELRPCDYYDVLDAPKIIYPDIAKFPRFFLDDSGIYIANTAYCLGTDSKYLLGILNSKLFWYAIGKISIPFGIRAGEYRYRLIYQYMEKVPIRPIDFSTPAEKAQHDKMVTLVEGMLELHKRQASANTPREKEMLSR